MRWQLVPHELDLSSYTAKSLYKDLVVQDATLKPPASQFDDWSLVGTVKNTGTGTAQYVTVHAAVYDASGKLLDGNYEFAKLDEIPPGGTSPFEMTFSRATNAHLTPSKQDIFVEGGAKQ